MSGEGGCVIGDTQIRTIASGTSDGSHRLVERESNAVSDTGLECRHKGKADNQPRVKVYQAGPINISVADSAAYSQRDRGADV